MPEARFHGSRFSNQKICRNLAHNFTLMTDKRKTIHIVAKAAKVAAWTLMAAVLLVIGILMATVKILSPDRLTPLAITIANKTLNADVAMARAELRLRGSAPFLEVEIDSLVVISRDMARLSAAVRDTIPEWADTLVCADKISGGINLAELATGAIRLNDVTLTRPGVNILIVDDNLNNFTLTAPTQEDTTTSASEMPQISINSFRLVDPKPFRFADLAGQTHICALFHRASITDRSGKSLPSYKIDIQSNISSPLLNFFESEDIPVALDGDFRWSSERPLEFALANFNFAASIFSGTLDTTVDLSSEPTIHNFDLSLDPVKIAELLRLVPADMAKEYSIPSDIDTDAAIAVEARLTRPYNMVADALPYASVKFRIPESSLRWRKVDLRRLLLEAEVTLAGQDLDAMTVEIPDLTIAGPATTLKIKGILSTLMSDPAFDGSVNGHIILDRLPPVITRNFGGFIKGRLSAETDIDARLSMFSRNNFHRLRLKGDIDLDDIRYLSADTSLIAAIGHACFRFGTNEKAENRLGRRVDSLLTAVVEIDTAAILQGQNSIRLSRLRLGVGAQNRRASADTTAIIPMGGRMQLGMFSFFALSDSAGVRIKDIDGSIAMQRFNDNAHLPLFLGNLDIKRISAGDNTTRMMLSDGHLNLKMNKLPETPRQAARRKAVKHIADSIAPLNPDIPIDSLYAVALRIHREKTRGHLPRVHKELTDSDVEIIDWGTSSFVRRLLLRWNITGDLTATRARLFTASFPVRNRMQNINISFDNDSIILDNVQYKAGHSDFLFSGNISNMKRAFTSRQGRSPVKIHLDVLSDTIDVNELANAFFSGAAASAAHVKLDESATDDELDQRIADSKEQYADSVAPVLIPTNIDAEFKLKARNVLYSDLTLNNLTGEILAYDGALNLHRLEAASKVGSVDITALYSAPSTRDMNFGFGMRLNDFNLANFLRLVPAVDSIMPLLRDFGGIISANIAATSAVDTQMNLDLATLRAAIKIEGDSLVVIDDETFKTMAKWLMFKNKNRNMINHISAEMIVENNEMQLFPFMFDFDRYRLGVQGYNDLAMNFDYHVAVLKSPIPFKFGLNIKGNPDNYKIRLGRARFNEKTAGQRVAIVDTTRVNLLRQFQNVFRRGVRNSRFATLDINRRPTAAEISLEADTISHADSLYLIREGLIPPAPGTQASGL